jgi:hypothetical protein
LERISKLENDLRSEKQKDEEEIRSEKQKDEEEIMFKINDDDFEWFEATTPASRPTSTKSSGEERTTAGIGQVRIFLLGAERSAH